MRVYVFGGGGAGGTLESAWLLPLPLDVIVCQTNVQLNNCYQVFLYRVDELFSFGSCLMHIDPQRLEVSSFDA